MSEKHLPDDAEIEWGVRYEGRGPFVIMAENRAEAEIEATAVEDKHAPAHVVWREVGEWQQVGRGDRRVHNHGPAEGRGLDCPEQIIDGRLVGACIGRDGETK